MAWVDAVALTDRLRKQDESNAHDYFVKHGVAVSDGRAFGNSEFFRLNLATSHELLAQALDKIESAIHAV